MVKLNNNHVSQSQVSQFYIDQQSDNFFQSFDHDQSPINNPLNHTKTIKKQKTKQTSYKQKHTINSQTRHNFINPLQQDQQVIEIQQDNKIISKEDIEDVEFLQKISDEKYDYQVFEQDVQEQYPMKVQGQNNNKTNTNVSKNKKNHVQVGSTKTIHKNDICSPFSSQQLYDASQNSSDNKKQGSTQQIQDLRMIFVDHFNNIQQCNGLVFKKKQRQGLNKQFKKKKIPIVFTQQHQLSPQQQIEMNKKRKQIDHIILFRRQYHKKQFKNQQQFLQYIQKDYNKIMQEFTQASYIFCQEVTEQLYKILRVLANIGIQNYKKGDRQLIKHFRQFGDKIVSYNDPQHKYLFFGYQFVQFDTKMTEQEKQNTKKQKFKYALKPRFRQSGRQFADFAQKAGLYLIKIISKLPTFQSLKI